MRPTIVRVKHLTVLFVPLVREQTFNLKEFELELVVDGKALFNVVHLHVRQSLQRNARKASVSGA